MKLNLAFFKSPISRLLSKGSRSNTKKGSIPTFHITHHYSPIQFPVSSFPSPVSRLPSPVSSLPPPVSGLRSFSPITKKNTKFAALNKIAINLYKIYVASFRGLSRDVWLLAGANLVNRAGSMLIPFLTLYLTADLGISIARAGYAISVYGVGSIIGSYAGGWLADRYNFLRIQLLSLFLNALLLVPLIFIRDFGTILGIIFVLAIVADAFRPANAIAVSHFAKTENRTRSYSLMRLAYNLGYAAGPAAGGIIAGTLGFKWLFVLDALTCVGAAMLLYRSFGSRIALIDAERYAPSLESDLPDDVLNKQKPLKQKLQGISAYKDKRYLGFILLVIVFGICFFQLFTSVPVYFDKDLHYSKPLIGILMGLNGLFVVIMEMPIVAALEGNKRFMRIISLGALMMIVAFVFLLPSSTLLLFPLLYTLFITLAEVLAFPFMMNYAVSRPHPSRQGQYTALYSMAFGMSFIFAPMFGMSVAEAYSFKVAFGVFIGISGLLGLLFYSLRSV